jgi:hypothetical protein
MKKLITILLCIVSLNYVKSQQLSYHIRNELNVQNIDNQLTKLVTILPLAQTNQYQTISNLNINNGTILDIPNSDDKYVRWIITNNLPQAGQVKEIYYDFDVTLNSFNFNFSQVNTIYPYDTSSDNYLWYGGTCGAYVDPNNSTIINIGNNLWSQSSDIIDYCRRCYLFVAENYSYIDAYTGLHTLQDIINAGGGDCGNLTSIYVSLLRYKNIPARHVVTVRPDGSLHVWSDFFLENYGWVPVDVTYKKNNPSGDFFGKYDGNGIVFTKNVWLPLDRGDNYTYYAPILQTFVWWYWYSSGYNHINASYFLTSNVITSLKGATESGNISIYPNPANNILYFKGLVTVTKVSVVNIQGKVIFDKNIVNNQLDISSLPKGMFVIKISDKFGTTVKKLTKN